MTCVFPDWAHLNHRWDSQGALCYLMWSWELSPQVLFDLSFKPSSPQDPSMLGLCWVMFPRRSQKCLWGHSPTVLMNTIWLPSILANFIQQTLEFILDILSQIYFLKDYKLGWKFSKSWSSASLLIINYITYFFCLHFTISKQETSRDTRHTVLEI